jgi:sec-independent protein translocase protein TatB
MNLFGIGPLEFLLIFIIAIIVLGPKGMVEGARKAGKFIRKIIRSPIWRDVVDTSKEIRDFPRKIAREAGIEKDIEDLRRSTQGTLREIERTHLPSISPIIKEEKSKEEKPSQIDTKEVDDRED